MKIVAKRLSIGLLTVALGSAVIGATGPAMAKGGHGGGGHHGGGWGHHGGGWGHGWGHGFGYGGYVPTYYYGGCYLKRFVTYDGDFVFKKICY
jgi:hypothetical protein